MGHVKSHNDVKSICRQACSSHKSVSVPKDVCLLLYLYLKQNSYSCHLTKGKLNIKAD